MIEETDEIVLLNEELALEVDKYKQSIFELTMRVEELKMNNLSC